MKEFEYVGEDTVLDTRLSEEPHKCPYEGCGCGCPYKNLSYRIQKLENKYKELATESDLSYRIQKLENKYKELSTESDLLKIKVALGGKR